MDNKLQQLTDKLYAEGLEKGKAEGEIIVEQAKAQADKIIKEASEKAAKITADARIAAQELARNTEIEVRSASLRTLSALKTQIEGMILSGISSDAVSAAFKDGSLTSELILKAVQAWNPSSENPVQVIVPDAYVAEVKKAITTKFNTGVDVVFDGKVRVPFRIAPANGGYYISFSQADFENMFRGALRDKVAKFLFEK